MKHTRVAVVLIAVGLLGCTAKKRLTADQYFHEASDNFRSGAFTLAIDQFHELLDQYPFSQYNEEAEIRVAHAHYLSAVMPRPSLPSPTSSAAIPPASTCRSSGTTRVCAYAKQLGTIDRDQAAAQNAQNVFLTLIQQYPDSPFADLARQQVARCRRNLAEHELYIARYYAKRGNDKAAEIRLLTLAARYGDTDASADGLLRLAKLYRSDKQDSEAVLAYRALAQMHPRSEQAAVAKRALERLAKVDRPPDGDPLDMLLAANGRQRSSGNLEVVQVPGLEPMQTAHRPSAAAGPGFVPSMEPFGRGGGRGFPY